MLPRAKEFIKKDWVYWTLLSGLLGGNLLTSVGTSLFVFTVRRISEKKMRILLILTEILFLAGITVWLGFPVLVSAGLCLLVSRKKSFRPELLYDGFCTTCCLILLEISQNNWNCVRILFFAPTFLYPHHFLYLGGFFVVFGFILLVKAISGKTVSVCIALTISFLFSITNFCVLTFTGKPFLLSDIVLFSTAMSVTSTQTFTAGQKVVLAVMIGFFLLVLTLFIIGRPKEQKPQRVSSVLLGVICIAIFCSVSVFAGTVDCGYIEANQSRTYSYLVNLFVNVKNGFVLPSYAKDYAISAKDYDINKDTDFKPNIIIVMNEAFSDPQSAVGVVPNEDPLAYFHSLQQAYPSGVTYSSTKGNKTVSSEWESLSGVSTGLTEDGAMVYQTNVRPMNTLISLANGRGYKTVSIHPFYGRGYNRENMYKNLGFSEIVFQGSMDIKNEDCIRGYASDKRDYEEIINVFENKGDDPAFIFNITMQNHGGYGEEGFDSYYATNVKNCADLNEYLTLLHESDEALKTLVGYFEKVEEPTIILFFGDHQPNVSDDIYEQLAGKDMSSFSVEETMKMYEIPYLIWANYETDSSFAPERTSTNYLSSILFKVGKIAPTAWMAVMNEAQTVWPVVTVHFAVGEDGDVTELRQAKDSDKMEKYLKQSYGILYGNERE